MSYRRFIAIIAGISVTAVLGCNPGGQPSATPGAEDAQALFNEWKSLVDNAEVNKENRRYLEVAEKLATTDPAVFKQIVDVIADPATTPDGRVMALTSLNGRITPEMLPTLLKLTQPEVDSSTRAGVVMLLSSVRSPEGDARIRELINDPNRRVKFAATVGLVGQGDTEARKIARDLYFEPDLPSQYRERIAFTLAQEPKPEDSKVLCEAASENSFSPLSRTMAISALVNLGDVSAIPSLEKCLEGESPQEIKDLARDAVASLKGQLNEQPTASSASGDAPAPAPAEAPASAAPDAQPPAAEPPAAPEVSDTPTPASGT